MTDDDYGQQRPPTQRMEPLAPYEQPYPTEPQPDGEPPVPPKKSGSGRTAMLSLIALLALALLVLAGFLVFGGIGESSDEEAVPAVSSAPSSVTSAASSSAPSTASSAPSSPQSTQSRPTAAPGAVTYQFTGSGNLVAVSYRTAQGSTVVAATGAPWSVQTSVGAGGTAELSGIVVQGPVTCTILHGEELLASSTSQGGPINCSAAVPD